MELDHKIRILMSEILAKETASNALKAELCAMYEELHRLSIIKHAVKKLQDFRDKYEQDQGVN